MDGLKVNWAFLELLKEDSVIIDTGLCSLHVVHGTFQEAFRNTVWEIDKFLNSIHNVTKILVLCTCERAIKILPRLKRVQLPHTYSVKKSAEILEDYFLPNLHLFLMIASSFEPLLRVFQTPNPTFSSVYSAVENVTRELVKRFIKPTILESAHTIYKLINIDVENVDNFLYGDVPSREAKNCLVKIVRKLIERSPLKYKFVQASICLDPKKILTKPEQCKTGFEACVGMLLVNHNMTAILADKAILQFSRFAFHTDKTEFSKFEWSKSQLDSFYAKQFIGLEEYKDVWQVVKIILMFSQGIAFVEGGFSINTEILVRNFNEKSLMSLRRVWDGIQDGGGEDAIVVDQKMFRYACGASAKQKEAFGE
ncbi:hypothetical protein PR048_006467 [Dryococelus australis]|uniref:Uncharacterized protein n=1 Tax=Dryococelus australis TaxID=614101 RepID=A0ABQ9IB52_9NEOP|nr:hypothetical protein PR048_006467 [Dryococelus australis]